MRAVNLVTTTPGGGPAVVQATQGDDRFTRKVATLAPFEVATKVHDAVGSCHPLLGR